MASPAKVIQMDDRRAPGPQLEDGFVRIANELFDAILTFQFSGRQQTVLLAIVRKTYGYGKKSDDMSASQIGDICGIARNHVTETLKQLAEMNVITMARGEYGMLIGINKHHGQWIKATSPKTGLVPKKDATSPKTGLELVPNRDKTSPKSGHTKDNQKTTSKDNPNTPTTLRAVASKSWLDAFEGFWNAFAYKHGKHEAKKSWEKLGAEAVTEGADLVALLDMVLAAARQEADRRPHLLAKGSTPKYAQGWLTDRRFEDESLQEWGHYSAEQQAVIDDYNSALAGTGWPAAVASPYVPERAAAIASFLGFSKKAVFWRAYFAYVAQNVPDAATTGIDWLIRPDTYAKIREGVHKPMVTA